MGYRPELFILKCELLNIYQHIARARPSVDFKDSRVIPLCSRAWESVFVFAYTVLSRVLESLVLPANSKSGYLRRSSLSNLELVSFGDFERGQPLFRSGG